MLQFDSKTAGNSNGGLTLSCDHKRMKQPVFGRRLTPPGQVAPSAPTGPVNQAASQGHNAVLDHLRRVEAEQPLARPQLVGRLLFDMTCKMITTDRGVRMEDILAILAANGGFACLLAALSELKGPNPPRNGITIAQGRDGHRYFFGDLPNRYLIEDRYALLSLALGAAQTCGGAVSVEMVQQAMEHVAKTVGGGEFGKPRLPPDHQASDLPLNYVRFLWPKFVEAFTLYQVSAAQRPAALGFALQQTIDAGKAAIDPTLAARIVIECALPMAKVDPERIAQPPGRG